MKSSQVNKLYAKLTTLEQATLAFEASTRQDNGEIEAIVAQVERRTYQSVHADYTHRVYVLQLLAVNYSIEYWRLRALMLSSFNLLDSGYQGIEETAMKFLAKAVALEIAIVDACKRYKVDLDAVKSIAQCQAFDLLPKERPPADEALVKQYAEAFFNAVE